MSKPSAPTGLGPAGSALWRKVTGKYELRADELEILKAACRATERVRIMEAERGNRVTAKGSMGQTVVHPLIPEIRATEAQVATLLAKLKLPDDPAAPAVGDVAGSEPGTRSTQARAAAQSRWAAAHGKGA